VHLKEMHGVKITKNDTIWLSFVSVDLPILCYLIAPFVNE